MFRFSLLHPLHRLRRVKLLPLATRLFLSHLTVMLTGLASFLVVSRAALHPLYSQRHPLLFAAFSWRNGSLGLV